MRYGYVLCIVLMLASCQSGSPPPLEQSHSIWYSMGLNDALAGSVVKDNETLVEWSGNPDVDRSQYLQGYRDGQIALCRETRLMEWGNAGKDFPASCDGVKNAEQLRAAWQKGGEQR